MACHQTFLSTDIKYIFICILLLSTDVKYIFVCILFMSSYKALQILSKAL